MQFTKNSFLHLLIKLSKILTILLRSIKNNIRFHEDPH